MHKRIIEVNIVFISCENMDVRCYSKIGTRTVEVGSNTRTLLRTVMNMAEGFIVAVWTLRNAIAYIFLLYAETGLAAQHSGTGQWQVAHRFVFSTGTIVHGIANLVYGNAVQIEAFKHALTFKQSAVEQVEGISTIPQVSLFIMIKYTQFPSGERSGMTSDTRHYVSVYF